MLVFAFPYPTESYSCRTRSTLPCDDWKLKTVSKSTIAAVSFPNISRARRNTNTSDSSESSTGSSSGHLASAWPAESILPEVLPGMDLVMRAHICLHDYPAAWTELIPRQELVECLQEVEQTLHVLDCLYHSSGIGRTLKRSYKSFLHKKRLARLEKAINKYLDCVDAASVEKPASSVTSAYSATSWNRPEVVTRTNNEVDQHLDEKGSASGEESNVESGSDNSSPTLPFQFSPCHEDCLIAKMPEALIERVMNKIREERSPYRCLARTRSEADSPSNAKKKTLSQLRKTTYSEKSKLGSYHHPETSTSRTSVDSDSDDRESFSEMDALIAHHHERVDTDYMYYMSMYAWI